MKKLLLAVISVGLLSISASAATGTVDSVKQYATGGCSMTFVKADGTKSNAITVVGTPDAIKTMIAIGLTAKSSGATVEYNVVQYSGKWGLGQLGIQ